MVNGLGSQCINYADEWCELFVDRGLPRDPLRQPRRRAVDVVRRRPDRRRTARRTGCRTWPLDALAVLDACGVERAHVMGLSMGGMIVQTLAIEHPDRLLSMTSVMSTTGEPEFVRSSPEAYAAADRAAGHRPRVVRRQPDRRPARVGQPGVRRRGPLAGRPPSGRSTAAFTPDGTAPPVRRRRGVGLAGRRAARRSPTPTLVIHGSADTLIDPIGGRRTAELVPGARFELIDGMGHDYPPQLWERWVDLVTEHVMAVRT